MGFAIVIEPTNTLSLIDGNPCQLWEGKASTGEICWVFVSMISISEEDTEGVTGVFSEAIRLISSFHRGEG